MAVEPGRGGAAGGRSEDVWPGACGNPFATRYVGSARVRARDAAGRPRDLEALADRLAARGGSGALVGAHGTGKSTLLRQLAAVLARRAIAVCVLRVRRPADTAAVLRGIRSVGRGGVACIDGFEVLGAVGRVAVRMAGRLGGVGVVVTAHRPGWPATLLECRASDAILRAIVENLPGRDDWFGSVIGDDDLAECFAAGAGNVRESLDLLYDRFERRRRRAGSGRSDSISLPPQGEGAR